MAAELVNSVTSHKMTDMDWGKSIEICELVTSDPRQAKDVIKAIKRRLGNKSSNTQLFTVMLLELLMNNVGEHIHRQVIDLGLLRILVKIVKKKLDSPARERIFLLLDATQTSLGGASGNYPQYYTAYYDLVSAGVQFPQRPRAITSNNSTSKSDNRNSTAAHVKTSNSISAEHTSFQHDTVIDSREILYRSHFYETVPSACPFSYSIIQKAGNALEVLKEVLDTAGTQNPEVAKDEFTLDLVEQCSFEKQRVMQIALKSRDEKLVSLAIDMNEELQKVLTRHDALITSRSAIDANSFGHEELEEEEEAEQLFRRIRKGKASLIPENESSMPGDRLHHHTRPLRLEPRNEPSKNHIPAVAIPPPPSKHVERKKFFQENKPDDGPAITTSHIRGLSLENANYSNPMTQSLGKLH